MRPITKVLETLVIVTAFAGCLKNDDEDDDENSSIIPLYFAVLLAVRVIDYRRRFTWLLVIIAKKTLQLRTVEDDSGSVNRTKSAESKRFVTISP